MREQDRLPSRALLLSVALLGTCLGTACGSTAPPSRPEATTAAVDDSAALRGTVGALNAAMTARDLDAAMAVFEESEEILLVGSDKGEVYRGREAVRGFLKMLMGLPFTFSFEMPAPVVRVDGDRAWLYVDALMVHTRANGTSTRKPYRFSVVAARRSGAWRWQLFHGSVPGAE